MYFLGYDIGSSSVKASIIDQEGTEIASAFYPEVEMPILAPKAGFAEQPPADWWEAIQQVTQKLFQSNSAIAAEVKAIGISYQMHGLVMVNKDHQVQRDAIIWCDSRAVGIGESALSQLGTGYCYSHLLNSPGNFTASKVGWVAQNEPALFANTHKIMLPGDYVAMMLTGEVTTTLSGLSEGIFWDFKNDQVSPEILDHFNLDTGQIPNLVPTFGAQGNLTASAASALGLPKGIPVTYRAGDQPNNAFSLNVLRPGEVAATAGTSGVIYGVTDHLASDSQSRVNTFAHVNHSAGAPRLGVLLCINGTGILNSWIKKNMGNGYSYPEMDELASQIPIGSDGLAILPFGNGAERVLGNLNLGAQVHGLEFNRHSSHHFFRAAQEGIVFALNWGLDVLKSLGMEVNVIRAGNANMFQSSIFCETLAGAGNVSIELFDTDGAQGAARGAAVGYGHWSEHEAFATLRKQKTIYPEPAKQKAYQDAFGKWSDVLDGVLHSYRQLSTS